MSPHGQESPSAGERLPILDEVGDALHRDFRRQEKRRRRRAASAVGAGVAVLAVGAVLALPAGDREPADRVLSVAAGVSGGEAWQLVLVEGSAGPCLQLRPQDGSGAQAAQCAAPSSSGATTTAVRTSLGQQSFVYGFSAKNSPAIQITVGNDVSRVATQAFPPPASTLSDLPEGLRVYVAALGDVGERAVTVEPQGPGDSDVILRVPQSGQPGSSSP